MNWESIIFAIIAAAVIPLIKWALDILKEYVEAKINAINNQEIASVVYDAYNVVYNSVLYVMQTYVDTLKAKGEFDPMAQEEALNMARKRATELINDTAKNIIEENYGNFSEWLDTQIEPLVRSHKN